MDIAKFEALLREPESEWLEYKRDAYPWPKGQGGEVPKSEFIKDILGFANQRRDRDAYIVLGAKHKPGQPLELYGISDLRDDSEFQNLLNQKTNRWIRFSYEILDYQEKKFGVFCMPQQDGLFWLDEDYGKLKKLLLYHRKGTSILPMTPGEIYEMGASSIAKPNVSVEAILVESNKSDPVKGIAKCNVKYLKYSKLPKLADLLGSPIFSSALSKSYALSGYNEEYPKQMANYLFWNGATCCFMVCLKNTGDVTIRDLSLKIFTSDPDALVTSGEDIPELPSIKREMTLFSRRDMTKNSPVVFSRYTNGFCVIERNGMVVNPGETKFAVPAMYVGSKVSKTLSLVGQVTGDPLPKPIPVEFIFDFEVKEVMLTLEMLRSAAKR